MVIPTTTPEGQRVIRRVTTDWMRRNQIYADEMGDLPAEVEEVLEAEIVDALVASGVPLPFWALDTIAERAQETARGVS